MKNKLLTLYRELNSLFLQGLLYACILITVNTLIGVWVYFKILPDYQIGIRHFDSPTETIFNQINEDAMKRQK